MSVLAALWWVGALWAAPLELGEVLISAEERSPLVARAAQELAKAEAARLGAKGAYDLGWSASGLAVPLGEYDYVTAAAGLTQLTPLWGAQLDAGYNLGVGGLPDYYGELATGPAGELSAGVTVPLLKGRAIDAERAALQAAGVRVEAAEAIVDTARLVVTRDASLAYWRWVSAGQRLALAEELLEIALARDAAIAARVTAGDLPEVDRLDNERIILERQARRADAERGLVTAEQELSLYLRDESGRPLVPPRDRLPDAFPTPTSQDQGPAEALVEQAILSRPELAQLERALAEAEVATRLAENSLQPKLDVKGAVAQTLGPPGTTPDATEVKVGVALGVPLQRREAQGKLDSARAEVLKLEAERRWLEDRVVAEVTRSLVALETAYVRWEATSRSVELARQLELAEQARFALGDADLLRVYQREQIFADAVLAEVDASLDYYAALAAFRYALGQATTEE